MKLHFSKVPIVLAKYLDEAVAPKSEVWQMVGYSLWLGMHQNDVSNFVQPFADKAGMIDIDKMKEITIKSMEKWGKGKCPLPWIKWILNSEDIEIICKIAESEAEKDAR